MTSEILASAAEPAREIAFIGGGNMARSLVGGLLARGWGASRIHVADPFPQAREPWPRDFGIGVHAVNLEAAAAPACGCSR
jgi:pyrroline-5-carboxylate reductase